MSERAVHCSSRTVPFATRSAFVGLRLVHRGCELVAVTRQRGIQCDAKFADSLRPLRSVEIPEYIPNNILFAVDDSDAAEEGARYTMNRVAKAGDCVHFVHVITDTRAPAVSVGEVTESSEDAFYTSSTDIFEAFPMKEHQQLLETQGEEMMKRRLKNMIQTSEEIRTEYHLPILTRPESASEIASVICDLASDLKVDILSIVSPSSGVFLECGSVGYHCYEQSAVPVLLLPDSGMHMHVDAKEGWVVVFVNSESERKSAVDWIQAHMSHIFNPEKLFIACLSPACTYDIPQSTKNMVKELESTGEKLQPACVVMYASSEMTVLDQLQEFSFIADYSDENRYPIVLLPKPQSDMHEDKAHWKDFVYSTAEILQA